MKRILGRLLALAATSLVVATSTVAATATAAQANGESFGCRIAPGTVFTFEQVCTNSTMSAYNYSVAFAVENLSGTGHTFAWQIDGPHQGVIGGCTSTSATCTVSVRRSSTDVEVSGSVTIYYATGGSGGHYALAVIMAWCDPYLC